MNTTQDSDFNFLFSNERTEQDSHSSTKTWNIILTVWLTLLSIFLYRLNADYLIVSKNHAELINKHTFLLDEAHGTAFWAADETVEIKSQTEDLESRVNDIEISLP